MRRVAASVMAALFLVGGARGADDLSIAREALRDGEWEVARVHAAKVDSDAARLIVLEALVGEGKWDEVGKKLAGWKGATGAAYDYYRAVVKGDHAAAMDVLKRAGSSEGLFVVKMYEAEVLAKAGRRDAANGLWREVASATNAGERVFATACANLMDAKLLRKAYATVKDAALRRLVGVRLGTALLGARETMDEGRRLVRAIVKESPDVDGAREAFLAVADAEVGKGDWKSAAEAYHEAIETWPDVAKLSPVQEGRGWAFLNLGRKEEALEAFRLAGKLAKDDESRARALLKEGDVLQETGKEGEAMAKYRAVLANYPGTKAAAGLKGIVEVREREAKGRELYRGFKFDEALRAFGEVAKLDASARPRMEFFTALCLYGQGRDDDACARMRRLAAAAGPDAEIRRAAMLWLAKFLFNRRDWKESGALFAAYADTQANVAKASEALLWAARAAFSENDFGRAIQLSAKIVEKQAEAGKARPQALLLQGQALIELARFDEAVLVFERVASSEDVAADDRFRARIFKADALYAMGADNPARYAAALEAYRSIQFGGGLASSDQVVVAFKIARTLVKLKRIEDAVDQYYSQVVLAYLEGRRANVHFTDEARAAFSRASFWLADEHESRGRDRQAVNILRLVAESDVPAAVEAAKRIGRIENKGRVL